MNTPEAPGRRSRSQIWKYLAVFGVALVLLLAGLILFLHTTPGRRVVISQITRYLQQQNISFSTEELNYNLLDLRISLRNVRVRSQDAPDLPPFASMARATVDLSLTQLLRRRYVVESGDAEGIAVHYLVDAEGRDNLPRSPRDPDQPSQRLNYLVEELQLRTSQVRYENRQQQIDVTLPVSLIAVEGDALTDRHTVRVAAARGTLAAQGRTAAIDELTGEFDLGEDDARIERLEVAAEGTHAALAGSVSQFADPRADLTLRGAIDAARVSVIANLRDPVGGAVQIDATVKGRLASPAISGHINGTDISFRNLSGADLASTVTYDLPRKYMTFSALELRAPFGQLNGHGALAFGGTESSRVAATASAIDAAALMRAFDMPYVIASRVDAEVRSEWPGLEYSKASGDAAARLTPNARPARFTIPMGGLIRVTARAGDVDALTRLNAGGAEVAGRVRMEDQRELNGIMRIGIADIAQVVSTAEAVLARRPGTLLPTAVAGGLAGTARIGGTLTAPAAAAELHAPSLRLGTAGGLSLTAGLDYTPAAIALHRVDVLWREGRAYAAGRIGLTGMRRLALTANADRLQVEELLRAANQSQVPASGFLSFQANVGGTIARPSAAVHVEGSELTAYSEAWGTLTAGVNLEGRQFTLADLLIDKPQPQGNGHIFGSGSYDLDRRTYTADLRSQDLQLVSLALPDGRQIRGALQLTAHGTGSIDQPAGNLNLAVDGLQVDQYAVGRVIADAVIANQRATITAAVPTYGLNADAVIGVQRPYATTARLRVEDLQLSTLPLHLQTPLEGQLQASADAAGNLDAPAQMDVAAVVGAFSGAWNNQPFSLDGPARLRYANERLAISQLRVVAQDSTLSVQGEMPLTERGAPGTITVAGRGNLATLARYAPAGTNLTGSGDVLLTGTIRGTVRAVDPDLEVSVANGMLTTPAIQPGISNLNLRARVADGEATIEQLTANWGAARLAAKGRIPLDAVPELPVDIPRRGGPATVTVQVDRLNLEDIPRLPEGLAGRVSVAAQVSANRADLTALEGQITFPELQLAFNGLTLNQEQESSIALARGRARVERFTLTGSAGTLSASGTVGLTGDRPLNVDAAGNVNVAAISVFTDAVRAEGETTLKVSARGPMASPELNGFVDMQSASFVVDEPGIAAENVATRLELSGRRLSVAQLTGSLNGGALTGSGHVEFGADGIIDMAIEMAADGVAFDAPLDLRSLSDSKIALRKRGDIYTLEGQVTLAEAGLTGDINFDEGLLTAMNARRQLDFTEERNAFLEQMRFNLNIDTAAPIIVDNNLARAEITADLRLIGTPYEPGLSGRLTVLEESEITLNERRYEVERGVITFIDERRILPSLDLRLNTSARNYDITLAITGTPGDTETSLTSNPVLPEPDIMAVLVTGRTLEEMRGEEYEVAREQVLSYLTGRVGSRLGRGLERATGFDTVRLEPNLIASETDPNARLTVGEDIAEDLELVYSVNLTDSNDQMWVADYDITRRFQTRGVRQSDSSYRFDLRHELQFGGSPPPARVRRERPAVARVSIEGDGNIPEAELRELLELEEGDEYSFFAMRNRVEDIEELFERRGYLQSRVRLQHEREGKAVNVSLNVTAGPRVALVFEGATPPAKVIDEIETQWRRGVFDTQRIDDSLEVLREWLLRDNYLAPTLKGTIEELNAEERRVRFDVMSGTRFTSVILAFEGANGIPADELDQIVNQQNLEPALFTDPTQVTELLERYYREQGYLVASIDKPRYEFQATQARIVLSVDEGPRFIVRDVTSRGNAVIAPSTLIGELPVRAGDPFLPFAAENALRHIRDVYWRRGYDNVRADYELVLDRSAGQVDVRFDVSEGPQAIIADITVTGNDKTSDRLVREQVELEPGQPLDLAALARSRKNLYDTQSFSIVDITREELTTRDDVDGNGSSSTDTAAGAGENPSGDNPIRLNVSVREVQPVQLRYGLSYDTERGVGGLFDASNHNSLGKGRVIGLTSRYDSQLLDLRGYISQPSLRYWPIQTTASIYYRDERNPETTLSTPFSVDRRGASIQQERMLANSYVWNWGFRYEKTRAFNPQPGGTLDELLTVTPLTTSLTREARDDVLDATRGSFSSHAFAYSPSWLGSDQAYIKYLGQYFHYIPLQRERRERFTNEVLRPRFVYAAAVRLGMARSFGGGLPLSERFFAGGATTLRGFEQNAVGEIDPEGVPLGGSALFVINNELRFPLMSIFDGVVFSDIGNVFRTASDLSLTDLRETAGVGLRVRTPWFLIRGDYGVPLDRRAGERRGRFYFSVGQAF